MPGRESETGKKNQDTEVDDRVGIHLKTQIVKKDIQPRQNLGKERPNRKKQ